MKFFMHLQIIAIGVLTSFVLGFVLKLFEYLTDLKVYTLLLNIDFIPIMGEIKFPEWIEFSFHIIISILLTYIFYYLMKKKKWNWQGILFNVSLGNMLIGLLIYPITLLSDRTPPFFSIFALNFWLISHLFYGISMSLLFIFIENRHNINKQTEEKNKGNKVHYLY